MGMSKGLFFFLTQKTSKQETQLAESFLATIPVQWIDSFCQKISDQQQSVVHRRQKNKTTVPFPWLYF